MFSTENSFKTVKYEFSNSRSQASKRISSSIGPILQRCKTFEKLGNVFDMKLIQNSEIRVFKAAIPQKSFTVDIMSWIHSLEPQRESVAI